MLRLVVQQEKGVYGYAITFHFQIIYFPFTKGVHRG